MDWNVLYYVVHEAYTTIVSLPACVCVCFFCLVLIKVIVVIVKIIIIFIKYSLFLFTIHDKHCTFWNITVLFHKELTNVPAYITLNLNLITTALSYATNDRYTIHNTSMLVIINNTNYSPIHPHCPHSYTHLSYLTYLS
jgi:hypothetical protein